MTGSTIITFDNGWAVSNDCEMDMEKDIDIVNRTSVATTVLKVNGLFIIKGQIFKDINVSLILRNEKGENLGFNGHIRSIADKKATIVLTSKHNRVNEILNNLKQENHGR